MALRSSLALTAAALALAVPLAHPQAPPPASPPAFDVVSIHENNTATDGRHHIYNDAADSRFRTVNLSLKDLLQFAYDLPDSQILGGPSWLTTTMFDIDAKSGPAIDAQLHALPPAQARTRKRLMVQALIARRFQLAAHHETRQLPVYALVVARAGHKLKPSASTGTTLDASPSRLHIVGGDDTIALLARALAQILGRVVVNNTGLSGRYDLKLAWTPDDAPNPVAAGASDSNAPPGIFTALQQQLGLKLESTRGPVPILVLDHAEPPSPNQDNLSTPLAPHQTAPNPLPAIH